MPENINLLIPSDEWARDLNPSARKAYALDQAVAAIYRALGAEVDHAVVLAGFQVELLVRIKLPTGTARRYAVDCKTYSKLVGLGTMKRFTEQIDVLRRLNLVDEGILVSTSGFTKNALKSAKEHHIDAIKFSDLQSRLAGNKVDDLFRWVDLTFREAQNQGRSSNKKVFVVMPFARQFDDVYVIGIREVAERLGLAVERADDIQFNTQILELIQQKLKDAGLVIADLSTANPNVLYEVGYAHAVGTPTILLSNGSQKTPFDVQSFNQVVYESLIDLRTKLEKRIRGTLGIVLA